MFLNAYQETTSDEQGSVRQSEKEVILQSINLMAESDQAPHDQLKRMRAIHFVRQLWSYFLNDLASVDNGMPNDLRAALISIGIFIMKHLERMRSDDALNFEPLREISVTIEKGLQ